MSRILKLGVILVLVLALFLTGCSGKTNKDQDKDNEEVVETGQETPDPEPEPEPEPEPVEDPTADLKSIDIKVASIQIDGNGDDWEGIEIFEITKSTGGEDLKYPVKVSLAWDGEQKLFLKGTLTAPGELLAAQDKDSGDWWSDDIIELFLVSSLPANQDDNQATAGHYAANAKHLFEAPDLLNNGNIANISLEEGEWTMEIEVPLEGEYLKAVKDNGLLFAKVGIEMNSGGEYSLLEAIGGFWDVDNYLKFQFVDTPASDGVKSISINTASISIDGKGDDWEGVDVFDITQSTGGEDLKYPAKVSLAWDGDQKLFLKGTLTAPGELVAAQDKDSGDWWSDDIIEVFLVTSLPADEDENKAVAGHYAASSKHLFEASDLINNGTIANISLKEGEWTMEIEMPLEGEYLDAVKNDGFLYVKVGIEMNSGGEYSLLKTTGGFWAVDNYIKLEFK